LLQGGGIFVAPGDETALTNAMQKVLTDEPARLAMGRRALEQANTLAWPRTARAALNALAEAAA
ncbi:MAG: glycosyltransferase, partial [Gemmatimonadota bacterium]